MGLKIDGPQKREGALMSGTEICTNAELNALYQAPFMLTSLYALVLTSD